MKKKIIVDFISNLILFILACGVLIFPLLEIVNVKLVLILIFGFYTLVKLISFAIIFREHDYENLFTAIISGGCLASLFLVNLTNKNIGLIMLIWLALMSLVKLKKADFYHDRANKMWLLRIFILFVFLGVGLLLNINLIQSESVQILILGMFFIINSLLDTIDPMVRYMVECK